MILFIICQLNLAHLASAPPENAASRDIYGKNQIMEGDILIQRKPLAKWKNSKVCLFHLFYYVLLFCQLFMLSLFQLAKPKSAPCWGPTRVVLVAKRIHCLRHRSINPTPALLSHSIGHARPNAQELHLLLPQTIIRSILHQNIQRP